MTDKMNFRNINVFVNAVDAVQKGIEQCVIDELTRAGNKLESIPQNALVIVGVNQARGVFGVRIFWRIDTRPFKKKFIKQRLEAFGYKPVRFLDFIAGQKKAA